VEDLARKSLKKLKVAVEDGESVLYTHPYL